MNNEHQNQLVEASTKLALSLIGRLSHCGGTICSSCHQQSFSSEMDINHVPSCLVGKVLNAVRDCESPMEQARKTARRKRVRNAA